MFGSRKKGKRQYKPPTAATVSPSAATAAVSAYNLSSSAAAAALRALPNPPTNVGAVQTKRTMRRSASVSSGGSRRTLSPVPTIKRVMNLGSGNSNDLRDGQVASPTNAPTLRRRGSASSMQSLSSMSERTFRSPSPHRFRSIANPSNTSSPHGSVNSSHSLSINAAGAAAVLAAGRSATTAGGEGKGSRSHSVPPPPVPSIPQHVVNNQASANEAKLKAIGQTKRRSAIAGVVQQPLLLASQNQNKDRSSWFGPGSVGDVTAVRTSDLPMDINSYAQSPSSPITERPGSRSSLHNFSYPARQRLSSPPASPTHARASLVQRPVSNTIARSVSTERIPQQHTTSRASRPAAVNRSSSTSRLSNNALSDQSLVYDANSRRMVPRAELLMLEQSIFDASEKSQRQQYKNKQQRGTAIASLAGSHLSQGTMSKSHGSAAPLNRSEVQRSQQQSQRVRQQEPASPKSSPLVQHPQAASVIAGPAEETEGQHFDDSAVERESEEAGQPVPALSTSTSTPSSSVSSLPALATSQAAPQQTAFPLSIQSQSSPDDATSFDGAFVTEDGRPTLVKRPSVVREDPEREEEEERRHVQTNQKEKPPQSDTGAAERDRNRSNSPVRIAHFSPVVKTNLTIRRHSPPPRSISPRKSAMKQMSSPRDASPSDSASEAGAPLYQSPSDVDTLRRKKANRVSFDEKAVVLSDSPIAPSQPVSPNVSSLPGVSDASPNSNNAHQTPMRSRSWFSTIGRNKKKSAGDISPTDLDDDDVVMKPRPALPSFGSVREKPHQAAQQEERALVRPTSDSQPSRQPAHSPPPSALKSTTPLETLGTSGDHAIGAIIAASTPANARNTANTSRFREPLPPVVTSVDGNGYVSDSGESISSNDDYEAVDVGETTGEREENAESHSPVLRFDEEQDTTVPAPLPGNIASKASSASVAPADEVVLVSGPSTPVSSPTKTIPAIAISHPSQENLVAVRGTGSDDEEDQAQAKATTTTPGTGPIAPVMPPSPKKYSPIRGTFDVPGTFPLDSDSDSTNKSSPTRPVFGLGSTVNSPVPTRQDTFEPISQDDDMGSSPQMPATVFATHMPTLHEENSLHNEKIDEEDSESEVFSDAYEDLSDVEGDGFLSLDAVVDSPLVPDLSKNPFGSRSVLTGSPSRKQDAEHLCHSPMSNDVTTANVAFGGAAMGMSALTAKAVHRQVGLGSEEPEDEEDWDKVKAFWRGLSAEKRAQLENEAREEAADDGDLEEESATVKKPRRKKSSETRFAEKNAIRQSSAQKEAVERKELPGHKTEKQAATRIRRSMRDKAGSSPVEEKGPAKSMKDDAEIHQQTTAKRERPMSLPTAAAMGAMTGSRPKSHGRTYSADSGSSSILQGKPSTGALPPSALRRRGSDSSESSFKRTRGDSNGSGGMGGSAGSGFRRSMRSDSSTANGGLAHRNSRFSLRSLSPTGSATLRGSTESSPQIRRTLRDGPGFASRDAKRMSSPTSLSSSTLRKGAAPEQNGFLSSFGKKSNGNLLSRSKNGGGSKSGHSRFGESSEDDDDDIFGPTAATSGSAPSRRSASAGAYTFRSRFVDSSDEDEIMLDRRTVRAGQDKDHVVPKTMRSAGSMRSASARPSSAVTPRSPPLPEELEEAEEDEAIRHYRSRSQPTSPLVTNSGGKTTLRRTRSGRGQISASTAGVSNIGGSSSPVRHRRASSIMSVLRRKKHDSGSTSGYANGSNKIQRAELMESAARRDTQLERSTRELEAMRSPSAGSSSRRRSMNRTLRSGSGSTPRIMPHEDDSDDNEDDSENGGKGTEAGARNKSWPLPGPSTNGTFASGSAVMVNELLNDQQSESPLQKKKKFPALRRMFRLND